MNIYGLLKCDMNTEPEVTGNKYLRLRKCYEFVLQESTDTDVRSIVEDKYKTLKDMEGEVPRPNPGIYTLEKGIQPAYLEALYMLDRFTNPELYGDGTVQPSFENVMRAVADAFEEEPTSVMNKYLYAAMAEVVKYLDENPGAM